MQLSTVIRLLQYLARGALYLLLLGALLFVGLTQTDRGRQVLNSFLVDRFNNEFAGTVQIEKIEGTIIGSLYAQNVRLLDPEGRVTATAQAIEISPRWVDLFQQKLTVRRLALQNPVIHLIHTSDSGYTLLQALAPYRESDAPSPWKVSFADISIRDGELHTIRQQPESMGTPPWLFDYRNASLDSINARGTVEWTPDTKLIDLQSASAYNRDLPLTIDDLQGQFLAENNRFSLNQIVLRTTESSITFGGRYDRSIDRSTPSTDPLSLNAVSFTLEESIISGDELSSVFPGAALADSFYISAGLRGTSDQLTIDHLRVSRGASAIDASGTLEHGADSIGFSLAAPTTTINPKDVAAVWPDSPLSDYVHLGDLTTDVSAQGILYTSAGEQTDPSTRLTSSIQVELDGAMGHIGGEIGLRLARDHPLTYNIDLTGSNLDLGQLEQRPSLSSRLNGTVSASGQGLTRNNMDATAALNLGPSTIGNRSIDSLAVELRAAAEQIITEARLYQYGNGGFLYGEADIRDVSSTPSYAFYLTTRDLDLGPLLPTDTIATSLNGSVTMHGRQSPQSELHGEALVTIDSSRIHRPDGEYTIQPAVSQVQLRPRRDPRPRLTLRGDIFDLTVHGEFTAGTLARTGQLWISAYRNALRDIHRKPRTRSEILSGGPLPGWYRSLLQLADSQDLFEPAADATPDPKSLQTHLARAGLAGGTRGVVDVRLHRGELLTTLLPSIPLLQGSLQTRAAWKANQDSIRLEVDIDSDSLIGPRLQLRELTVSTVLQTVNGPQSLPSTTRLEIQAEAPYVELPMQTFRENRLDLQYEHQTAHVQVESQQVGSNSALRAEIGVELLGDRNRVSIDQLRLRMRNSEWYNPGPQTVDLYENAVVFRDVILQNRLSPETSQTDSLQSIRLDGALSDHQADTAYVRADNLHLAEFSRILDLDNPIGGILGADVALTQSDGTIETTGDLRVNRLTFDGHPLGTLRARSQYHPVHDALNLDVTIAHENPLPNGIQNHVKLTGSVGLPQRSTTERYLNPGFLDLSVDVGEADLFFLENIFPGVVENVQATASGTGGIRGDFRRPIFEGKLEIADSSQFYQPDFNLNYQISGPITVDAEGFNVDGMRLTDPTGGSAALSGDILFNEYEFFSFDLQAELDELQTINVSGSRNLPFYGQIWSSGTAYLTGPLYDALLRSPNVVTTPNSELYIPVTAVGPETDETFIVFADSTGQVPEIQRQRRRENILADRPPGERPFLEGLDMNLNIDAPRGSTVHLVFDPLLGDIVEAVGSGRVQLGIDEGDFTTFGTFNITGGEYLFTAGDMFSRRFELESGGTITWDGDPIDAQLDIPATFRTRASLAGLPGFDTSERIPLLIDLRLSGRVTSPVTDMSLAVDRDEYTNTARITGLEPILTDEQRADEYATSVLLTNSFALTATGSEQGQGLTESVDQLAFSTVSQLVANQLNRFINHALSNVDVNLGMQRGTTVQDLDVTYGVALYLLDERLVIRGQGVYETARNRSSSDHLQGKLTVEVRLSPTVSMEVFYRREEGLLESASPVAPSYGAGVSYQTDFTNWRHFLAEQWADWKSAWRDIIGFLGGSSSSPSSASDRPTPTDSTAVDSVAHTPIIFRNNIESITHSDSDPLSGN